MGSLLDLYQGLNTQQTKVASDENLGEWEKLAAANNMTVEQAMEKVAESMVEEEAAMMKTAGEAYMQGLAMAQGYWDTMSKVAAANPVRDGIPEIFSKIAQQSQVALVENFVKVGGKEDLVEAIVREPGLWNAIKQYAGQAGGAVAGGARRAWEETGVKGVDALKRGLGGAYSDVATKTQGNRAKDLAEAAARLGLPVAALGGAAGGTAAMM